MTILVGNPIQRPLNPILHIHNLKSFTCRFYNGFALGVFPTENSITMTSAGLQWRMKFLSKKNPDTKETDACCNLFIFFFQIQFFIK